MMAQSGAVGDNRWILPAGQLQQLFDSLVRHGYQVIAPTVVDEAIAYEPVGGVEELPIGVTDEQRPGVYRLKRRSERAFFSHSAGAHSWKRYLYPPRERLWQARKNGDGGFEIVEETPETTRYAFVGVRACDLSAIQIQDRVFLGEEHHDAGYARRRENVLLIAVNCTHPSSNCFCASVGTGPRASSGYDLALTEVLDSKQHFFAIEVGTERGRAVLDGVPVEPASEAQWESAMHVLENSERQITKRLDTTDLKELLYRHLDSPQWNEVAKRCLTCANCTMVCPTCFCHTVEDVTNLQGTIAERWRKWDSCFHIDFSYIHGSPVRVSEASRYRQWITHKLASWQDQFGMLGCVGCGRCITWCPVGIDITEEVSALRRRDESRVALSSPKEESHAKP